MAVRSKLRWRSTAIAIALRSRSQRAVLPAMSVKRKVTVPLGRSGMIRVRSCGGTWCVPIVAWDTGPKVDVHPIAIQDDSGRGGAGTQFPYVRETIAVLRLGEAQSQALQGEPTPLADDEVIEQLDSEQLSGRHDLHREGHVGRRGRRIAGGVVMNGDEGGRLLAHPTPEDLTRPPSTCAA